MLHNRALCKVWFWRATLPLASPTNSPERGLAASQPRSDRLRGLPDCRPSHLSNRNPPIPTIKPNPATRALLLQLSGCHAFCKQKERAAPALRFHKKALRNNPTLTSMRQIALPEYRQGEYSDSRPRLRERVGPLYTAPAQAQAPLRRAPASNQPSRKKRPKHQERSALPINHQPQNRPGQGSRSATLRRLRSLPTAAPRSQPTTNPISQHSTTKQYHILARLKAEELFRRARMKRFGKNETTQKNSSRTPSQALISAPSCSSSPAVTLFAKKTAKSPRQPSASARRRSEVTRCSCSSGKSPCRSTGKANIQIVARASAKG